MSKITYVLANTTNYDVGLGSAGILRKGSGSVSLTVEEDSPDDQAIASAVASGLASVVSVVDTSVSASRPPRPKSTSTVWATRPLTGNVAGDTLLVSDVGSAPGTYFAWNGTRWRPINGRSVIAHSSVPVILPSSGSANTTGALTITTALAYVPAGTVGVYLPPNAVVGDAVGGVKPATFTTTQAAQLVGNPTTTNGAYTQTTGAALPLVSIVLPAGMMGPNSMLRVEARWAALNNANAKSLVVRLGAAGISLATSLASGATGSVLAEIRNRGALNVQGMTPAIGTTPYGLTTSAVIAAGSVDTAAATSVNLTIQIATATDWMILEGYSVELTDA